MAIFDFTAAQVLTAAQMDNLQANDYNQTVATKTANYVLVAADKGTRVAMNAAGATTITVNTALFAAGDTLAIHNIGAGVCTITANTATVASAGSLAIPTNGSGTLYFTSAGVAIYFPSAVTVAAGGLVLLQTLSPSAVTSAQFTDGLLTSTYSTYMVTIDLTFAAHASFLCQLRNAGLTISSANYGMYATGFGSNSATDNRVTNAGTSWIVGYGNTETLSGRFDFFSPSVSRSGNKGIGITGSINGAANANVTNNVALQFAAAQAFTSLIFTSAQAFTGTICVYGVSK